MAEAAALPVDTGLTWTNCRWIFRTKLPPSPVRLLLLGFKVEGFFLKPGNGAVRRLKFN